MLPSKLWGETSGEIEARRPPLAHANRRMAHVASKCRQFVMARVAEAQNGFLLRAIAVGAVGILVGVVSWTLATVLNNSNDNARAIAAMDARLERMETDIQRLIDDR